MLLIWMTVFPLTSIAEDRPLVFTGICDASAAAAVNSDLFVVANDEDNLLRFYRLSQPGAPIHVYEVGPPARKKKKPPEMDIEGAARMGSRVFWISSHGQNADGEFAPNRHQLFALDISDDAKGVRVRPVGTAYTNLVADMAREPRLVRFQLEHAALEKPKTRGGLNIEALTDTPDGALLIGFRNPIPGNRALLVPLLNPDEVLTGAPAQFGDPILLDLDGLGLRGMGSTRSGYYLIAGPAQGEAESRLFFWRGGEAVPERLSNVSFAGLNPEGICFHDSDDRTDFLLLSDDGTRNLNGEDCKDLPASERQFRAVRIPK
jgi:hypothetical protein